MSKKIPGTKVDGYEFVKAGATARAREVSGVVVAWRDLHRVDNGFMVTIRTTDRREVELPCGALRVIA